jgi:hypothetical protein
MKRIPSPYHVDYGKRLLNAVFATKIKSFLQSLFILMHINCTPDFDRQLPSFYILIFLIFHSSQSCLTKAVPAVLKSRRNGNKHYLLIVRILVCSQICCIHIHVI